MSNSILNLFFLLSCFSCAVAWDSEQLEVFDVVDEVKQNFYELLNISKDASNSEIKTAFRSLSLKLHPDKNKDVDTSEQFRNLVSVYEVLRNPTKRKYYDEVLVNGLPNWRSGLFYYRYVRKMGISEVIVILFVIATIGQYLMKWGAYLEKKMTLQDQIKVHKKVGRKAISEKEINIEIPKPSVFDTLPIQIPKLIWYIIISLPSAMGFLKGAVEQKIEDIKRPSTPEPEPEPPTRVKTVRKRNKFVPPEGPNFEMKLGNSEKTLESTSPPPMSGGLWTDDDLTELIRLVKKYPQGAAKRWESIAAALGRSVPEVTYMANKMKENGYKAPTEPEEVVQVKVKQKTKKEIDIGDAVKNWSQDEQKALEDALARFPKGCSDRWDRISEHVPGKTKDECMMRFRYLAENLKKQKQSTRDEDQENRND